MDSNKYENLISGIERYYELYEKGLKKQANQYIGGFLREFENSTAAQERNLLLYKLCEDICDREKYVRFEKRGNGALPYELLKRVWTYLKQECDKRSMPQMRWAFQIFGNSRNPFDPKGEYNLYEILEKAYDHKDCDRETADLYFNEMIQRLDWGAHHFPEGCIITKEVCLSTIETARRIMREKTVSPKYIERFQYYVRLYQCFDEYEQSGRKKDFNKICQEAGIAFGQIPAYYY